MKMQIVTHYTVILFGLSAVWSPQVDAVIFEDWNDAEAMTNNWFYFDGIDYEGTAPDWQSSGGIDNSPHVRCPLGLLAAWDPQTEPYAYYPLYTYDQYHSVNLLENPHVSIAVRDTAFISTDLQGGALYFFVGEWIEEDNYYFVYFNPVSFAPTSAWTTHTIHTTTDPGDWTLLGSDGPDPDLATLLSDPQQWGFTIRGGTAPPMGQIGFDNLAVIPEPATHVLIFGLTALGYLWLRRRTGQRG